jgi:hypothetical protein
MNNEFERLERKVDTLLDAVTKLVLFEERQTVQSSAISRLTERLDIIERSLDKWIQRGIGAWAIVLVGWTVLQAYRGYF